MKDRKWGLLWLVAGSLLFALAALLGASALFRLGVKRYASASS